MKIDILTEIKSVMELVYEANLKGKKVNFELSERELRVFILSENEIIKANTRHGGTIYLDENSILYKSIENDIEILKEWLRSLI